MIKRHRRGVVAAAVLLLSGLPITGQTGKAFKARLAPVPVDLTMTPTVATSESTTAERNDRRIRMRGHGASSDT